MNKLYLYGVSLLIAWFLYSQFMGMHEKNAKLESANSLLTEASRVLGEEIKRRSALNAEREAEKEAIEADNRKLQDELKKLKTTPQQAICDATPTPDGYADRLLNPGTD